MMPGLTVRVIWQDEHLVELCVSVRNADFGGRAEVYTTYSCLMRWADELSGFPRSSTSEASFDAGSSGPFGSLHLRFCCFDTAGHAAFHAVLQSNVATDFRPEQKSRVELEAQFEPVQLDRFVAQLRALISAREGEASLIGIQPYTQNIEGDPH